MGGAQSIPLKTSYQHSLEPAGASHSRTLENYIAEGDISSRWRQNQPDIECIGYLRSLIVGFAQLESNGIMHGFIGPEHIKINDDNRIRFIDQNIPPPTHEVRQIKRGDLTYKKVFQLHLVKKLLGDPKDIAVEEYKHFYQLIISIKLFKNLWYHPLLQSLEEKFYFPGLAMIWLNLFYPNWRTEWINYFKDKCHRRPFYGYTMKKLIDHIKNHSPDFLGIVLDMEQEKKKKKGKGRKNTEAGEYVDKVTVITIFSMVWNFTERICDKLYAEGRHTATVLQVAVETIEKIFPGFYLDLYDFLVHVVNVNLDFLDKPSHRR